MQGSDPCIYNSFYSRKIWFAWELVFQGPEMPRLLHFEAIWQKGNEDNEVPSAFDSAWVPRKNWAFVPCLPSLICQDSWVKIHRSILQHDSNMNILGLRCAWRDSSCCSSSLRYGAVMHGHGHWGWTLETFRYIKGFWYYLAIWCWTLLGPSSTIQFEVSWGIQVLNDSHTPCWAPGLCLTHLCQSKLFTEIDTSGDGILQLDEFVTGIEKARFPDLDRKKFKGNPWWKMWKPHRITGLYW